MSSIETSQQFINNQGNTDNAHDNNDNNSNTSQGNSIINQGSNQSERPSSIFGNTSEGNSIINQRSNQSERTFGNATSARSQDATGTGNSQRINNNNNSNDRTLIDLVSSLTSTVQSLQQNVATLTNKVNTMATERVVNRDANFGSTLSSPPATEVPPFSAPSSSSSANQNPIFNLESAYNALRSPRIPAAAAGSQEQEATNSNYIRTPRGYAAESLPYVETITPQLRKNIISGMDINLATLLIPYYAGSGVNENNEGMEKTSNFRPDPRINRHLNIGEFIQAFGVYKNIMCSAYPQRRSELDLYERDIIDMASRYPGPGFYEYHKKFSLDAAAHLRYNNIVVDWSIRNNTLFCNIFANTKPNSCNICGSTFHSTGFCNQSVSISQKTANNKWQKNEDQRDTYGRDRVVYLGREICNNYNGSRGCNIPRCRNIHVCLLCKLEHPKTFCPQAKNDGAGLQKPGAQSQKKI